MVSNSNLLASKGALIFRCGLLVFRGQYLSDTQIFNRYSPGGLVAMNPKVESKKHMLFWKVLTN